MVIEDIDKRIVDVPIDMPEVVKVDSGSAKEDTDVIEFNRLMAEMNVVETKQKEGAIAT
jgi:hypothetical protein